MAGFFKLHGIAGDSKDKHHQGWMDLEYFVTLKDPFASKKPAPPPKPSDPDVIPLKEMPVRQGLLSVVLAASPATARLAATKKGTYFSNAIIEEQLDRHLERTEFRQLILVESRYEGRNQQGTPLQLVHFEWYT